MHHDMRGNEKSHNSDPSASTVTSRQRDIFAQPARCRSQSLSPKKRLVRQPLHIRMNLTESQMDKITDAFSHKVHSSPARTRVRAATVTPKSKSGPREQKHGPAEPPYMWSASPDACSRVDSPTFSELMPGRNQHSYNSLFPNNLAERRHKAPPPPLQLGASLCRANKPQPMEMENIFGSVSPLSEDAANQSRFENAPVSDEDPESVYSQDIPYRAFPKPLQVGGFGHHRSRSKLNDAVVDAYKDWAQIHTPSPVVESTPHPEHLAHKPRRSRSTGEGLRQSQAAELDLPPITPRDALRSEATPLFSPLQLYFRGPDFPSNKKGEKTMIGENGWLERTDKSPDRMKKTPYKKGGILEGIKKIAKDMAELHHNSRRAYSSAKERPDFKVAISLDSREQSLLYCELEFNLSSALNDYITVQLDKGRLAPDKLKRVDDGWQHKGRPKVVGFRYDLETQLELINLHVDDFRFYGRRQGDPVEICGLLHTMKVNARAISVRTFCQPDSVVAKQLVDAQSLFKLLGVPDAQQIALAEIAQFFKVVVEREADHRAQRQSEGRRTKMSYGHEDTEWPIKATVQGGGGI